MLDTLEQTFMKSKRNEEEHKIMAELQYIDVSQTNALCTLDTIIRLDAIIRATEGPGNLYSCKNCIFKDTIRHDVSICPYRWLIQKLLR